MKPIWLAAPALPVATAVPFRYREEVAPLKVPLQIWKLGNG